jgi:hypothetical protein
MVSFNQYHGYVKLPGKKLYNELIHLDFNGHVDARPESARLEGFSLRMFVRGKREEEKLEMCIKLTPEQWLDLIDGMKAEFESVQKARKAFEDLQ